MSSIPPFRTRIKKKADWQSISYAVNSIWCARREIIKARDNKNIIYELQSKSWDSSCCEWMECGTVKQVQLEEAESVCCVMMHCQHQDVCCLCFVTTCMCTFAILSHISKLIRENYIHTCEYVLKCENDAQYNLCCDELYSFWNILNSPNCYAYYHILWFYIVFLIYILKTLNAFDAF